MIQPFFAGYYFYKTCGWYFFSCFSGLQLNLTKPENAGTGVLNDVQVAVCGMRCRDIMDDTLEILDTHFSYNGKLRVEKKICKTLTDVQRVLTI